jgi:serine/threonine-protein kinase OSR1/STK39
MRISKFIGAVEDEWQLYSDSPADYTIGPPIGFGASSIVYSAVFHPPTAESSSPGIRCAVKVLDLDSLAPGSLQLLQRETTLMSLSKHPNVLRVRGSWVEGHRLYIAIRLMNKGSAADVMRYGWPGGMEEDVVRCILSQALSGLNYLHVNGFIHRDVKAANLLVDDDGTVLLGDLGVAADLDEQSSKKSRSTSSPVSQPNFFLAELGSSTAKCPAPFNEPRPSMRKRKSFVGTPCWMAPEVIQRRQYDSSADIWSFGITALELTQGNPPRYRELPSQVLLKIIQEDPPLLDRAGGVYKYSRAFKEIVESCLMKDPSKRPTAEELLQTPFFRAAKNKSYLVGAILKELPPLTQRQERRVVNHLTSIHSVESWDFPTIISPLAPIYRKRHSEDLLSADDRENSNIFLLTESSEPDLPPRQQAKREIDVLSSSGTSTGSSALDSITTRSTTTSYTGSTGLPYGIKEKLSSESRPGLEPLASTTENTNQSIAVSSELSPPAPFPRTPSSQRFILPSTSPSQQGLWSKIRSNVRASSRSDNEGLDNSPRKERGKIGGMFASASKGLLLSSRSLVVR